MGAVEGDEIMEIEKSDKVMVLEKLIDEFLALIVVVPITIVLTYLAYIGSLNPQVLLVPYGVILGHYFTKVTK